MIRNLIKAFKNSVMKATWITTEKTQQGAIMKADNFLIKLGMPDKPPDHEDLFMIPGYVIESIVNANRFFFKRMLDECGSATDFTEWGMTPQTVNAYYNPRFNEFVIPAGIFQKPFFDITSSAALNYGSIGAVIGHEMTHSIDPSGRKYNWMGNREDWTDPKDEKEFDKIVKGLIMAADRYQSTYTFGIRLNGEAAAGEICADNGG